MRTLATSVLDHCRLSTGIVNRTHVINYTHCYSPMPSSSSFLGWPMKTSLVEQVVDEGLGVLGPAIGEMDLVERSSYTAATSRGRLPITGVRCRRPGGGARRVDLYLRARPPWLLLHWAPEVEGESPRSRSCTTVGIIGQPVVKEPPSGCMIGVTVCPIVVAGA